MPGSENAGNAAPIVRVGGCSEARLAPEKPSASETRMPRPTAARRVERMWTPLERNGEYRKWGHSSFPLSCDRGNHECPHFMTENRRSRVPAAAALDKSK